MQSYDEIKEFLKKSTVLQEKAFEHCLSLAYEDVHSEGSDAVVQRFKDIEFIFIEVYNIGYADGYWHN